MATDGPVARFNQVAYPAGDERLLDSVLLGPGPASAPFSARGGRRVNGAGLTVSVAGSPEEWSVTPGAGVIYDSANASAGGWRFATSTTKSGIMPARPGSGQSRIDYVIARIYDTDVLVSGPRELKIEHFAGTPGTTPSPPDMTLRPLSVVLATLTVPNTGLVSVTQSTARTVAAGGILPVQTTAEMDALTTAGIAYRGMVVDNAQTDALHRYDGTNWNRVQPTRYAPVPTPTVDGSATGPGSNPIIRLLNWVSATTSPSGLVTVVWPTPFPNGILHAPAVATSGAANNPVINAGALSKTQATYIFPGVNNTAVNFTYEAVGW